jgi:tripartite-type tricarboxylate transporter receptor subunit TctC
MTLYPNPFFVPRRTSPDFGIVNTSASTIMARKTLPPNNMAELVKWMKEPGQNPKVAHAGVGSFGHLCGVLFVNEVGAAADQIPYRGGGPALNDLVAGHADLSCLSAALVAPQVQGGNLKVYGIVDKKRAGLRTPDHERSRLKTWTSSFGILFALTGTPRPIVDRVNGAVRAGRSQVKEVDKERHGPLSADQETPDRPLCQRRDQGWGDVIRANKITAQ